MKRGSLIFMALLLLTPARSAEIAVDGLGWFGNRETARALSLLLGNNSSASLDAGAIEDAALILHYQLIQDGYGKARIEAAITLADGSQLTHDVDPALADPLPRPLEAQAVRFNVTRGVRFLIEEVRFEGLTVLEEEEARAFFVGETMLIQLDVDRVYSPAGVRRSLSNLEEELRLRGYADVTVKLAGESIDEATGLVKLRVAVNEGPLWHVNDVGVKLEGEGPVPPHDLLLDRSQRPWSPLWRQDTSTVLRRWYYERGYPDVRVRLASTARPERVEPRLVDVVARISPGPEVRIGEVKFTGNEYTREDSLRRLVRARTGALLDPVRVDNSQARLARLGVFDRVDVQYGDAGPGVRDIEFVVSEGRRQEVNLLAGWGSYEQLRGGVEWQHYNLFGRAHTNNLRLIQSIKSTRGDYRYTVPELFGTRVDGSARLFGLRREEFAFVREEYGANLSLTRPIRSISSIASLRYTFQRLRSTSNTLASSPTDRTQSDVASIDFRLVHDRRDSPLTPRHGHRAFLELEEASKVLGGEVDYQRLTVGGSYHTSWGRGRWIHAGLEHGLVTTFGSEDDHALPVNVRFFPGGDGSIRGYREGEAAPRAPDGRFIGAKSYLQLNTELEQAITPKFSAVLFVDAMGAAVQLEDYPFNHVLVSAGLGIRYHTLIGPVRLEYGYNLNRRDFDPTGALLISVGMPF
jgi:outer membrane protein insertion porin family